MVDTIGVWVMAFVTLGVYSILWKENRVSRIVEHLYVGVTAGNAVVVGWRYVRDAGLTPLSRGNVELLIPMLLGLLLYTQFSKQYAWLSRYAVSWLVGTGIGVSLVATLNAQFIQQVLATMKPVANLDLLVILVGVLGTVMYFHFSAKQTPAVSAVAAVGRWAMMITFGASAGNVVMGRIALVINRFQDLLSQWLHVI